MALNFPNALAMFRIAMVVPIMAFTRADQIDNRFVIAAALFLVASFTDFLDGYWGRLSDVLSGSWGSRNGRGWPAGGGVATLPPASERPCRRQGAFFRCVPSRAAAWFPAQHARASRRLSARKGVGSVSLIGKHCVLELYDCDRGRLDDREFLVRTLRAVAEEAGASWLDGISHGFEPHGVTVVGLLAESHISVHTWPEHGYAAADVFTCGDSADPVLACRLLARAVGAKDYSLRVIPRAGKLADNRHDELTAGADAAAV